MNVGGGIHCPCIHPMGVAIAITLQHVVVDQLTWKWLGLGLYPNLSRVANNFLFLFVFMAYELAIHSTTFYTDSKSFLCHSFYYFLYRFKIIFEICDLKPTRHQNHSKLMLIYALGIMHYASGSICA
jgi:hypothetical protein